MTRRICPFCQQQTRAASGMHVACRDARLTDPCVARLAGVSVLTPAERLESTQTPVPSFGERCVEHLRVPGERPTLAFAPERAQSDLPPVSPPEPETRATGLIERADAWLAETPAGNAATLVAIGAFLLALLAAALVGGK